MAIIQKKIEVIANGSSNRIDTQYFDFVLFSEVQKQELKQSLLIQPNDFVYIFVGRLVDDKGINELISELLSYIDKVFIIKQNIFQFDVVSKLVEEHLNSKIDITFRVWTYYCFQKWYKNTYEN